MFYWMFSAKVDLDWFKLGKIYRIKENCRLLIHSRKTKDGKVTAPFFSATTEFPFKKVFNIPIDAPLFYVGITEKWGTTFHTFLYNDMRVMVFGLLNSSPSDHWTVYEQEEEEQEEGG
jgi:hypothetical protein